MIKNIIITGISLLLLISCSSKENPDLEYFMEQLDKLTLEEAVQKIKEESVDFQMYEKLFSSENEPLFASEVKDVPEDEESYGKFPEFMQPVDILRNYDEYLSTVYLWQTYNYPETELNIKNDKYGIKIPAKPRYSTKAIYYHDGSVDTTQYNLKEWMDFNTTKVIDSIKVTAHYSYATGYDRYDVKDKLDIEGGNIHIVEKKGNWVKVRFSGKAKDYEEIVALNKDGKPISLSSSSSNTEGADKVYKAYAKAYKTLATKADSFKTMDELKAAARKALKNLPALDDEDMTELYNGYFRGNVASIAIYVPQEKVSEKKEITLVNKNANKAELVYTYDNEKEKYGFTNQAGEFVIEPVYDDLYQWNDLYYYTYSDNEGQDYDKAYFLDVVNKTLVKIPEKNIYAAVSSSCIAVAKDSLYDKFAIWGAEGNPVTDYIYSIIEPIESCNDLIKVYTKGKYGLYNNSGKMILPAEYTYIGGCIDNCILVDKNNKPAMFIDKTGKSLIQLAQYDKVLAFSDDLAAVQKNNKWGFIDTNGKLVIPCKYERAEPFSYGVTMVEYDDYYGLINTKDEIIVPITSSGYSLNTNFGKRAYWLNGIKYNEYGEEVIEPEEDDF